MAKERGAFFDVDAVRQIPILEVCREYGLELKRMGEGRYVTKLRNEKTASCYIYERSNSYCDYGGDKGSSVIDLVMAIEGCDFKEATYRLANTFDIKNENGVDHPKGIDGLSARQFAKIGIDAMDASLNFDINVERFGDENGVTPLTARWQGKTIWELANEDSARYHNVLRARACPTIHTMRTQYYRDCAEALYNYRAGLTIADAEEKKGNTTSASTTRMFATQRFVENKAELQQTAAQITTYQKWLMTAITDKSRLNPKFFRLDAEADIQKIADGTISYEVGTVSYPYLKYAAATSDEQVRYAVVSMEQYNKAIMKDELGQIGFAAFCKGDEVNLCCLGKDLERVLEAVNRVEKIVDENELRAAAAARDSADGVKEAAQDTAERTVELEL